MSNETIVTLHGNVGGEVSLRHAGGVPVANFRVACTPRHYRRRTEEWVDGETQWYTVNAWRQLGEHCRRSLHTGDPVLVQGRLTQRTYINKHDVEVTALEVEALTVGHDLSKGVSAFTRRSAAAAPRAGDADPQVAGAGEEPPTADPWPAPTGEPAGPDDGDAFATTPAPGTGSTEDAA